MMCLFFLELCVNFSQSSYNIDENKGPVQPKLMLSNPSTIEIIFIVFSKDGSATGKYLYILIAYAIILLQGRGIDYNSGPYNVAIPAGNLSSSFNVSINDDNVLELNEEFYLAIDQSSLPNGINIDIPNSTIVKISDNDCK